MHENYSAQRDLSMSLPTGLLTLHQGSARRNQSKNVTNQAAFRCTICFLTTFFRWRLGKRVPSSLPRDFSRLVGG